MEQNSKMVVSHAYTYDVYRFLNMHNARYKHCWQCQNISVANIGRHAWFCPGMAPWSFWLPDAPEINDSLLFCGKQIYLRSVGSYHQWTWCGARQSVSLDINVSCITINVVLWHLSSVRSATKRSKDHSASLLLSRVFFPQEVIFEHVINFSRWLFTL